MHDERRGAVRRRLDAEREHDERRDPPLPQDGADERDQPGDDRQHDSAGDDRADQRGIASEPASGARQATR